MVAVNYNAGGRGHNKRGSPRHISGTSRSVAAGPFRFVFSSFHCILIRFIQPDDGPVPVPARALSAKQPAALLFAFGK